MAKSFPTDEVEGYSWMTNDGRALRMAEIEDSHLLNIIGFLKKRALGTEVEGLSAMAYLQGEMAIAAVESQLAQRAEHYDAQIIAFEFEAKERGLKL